MFRDITTMTQEAPYPETLQNLVDHLTYKDGWKFDLGHVDRGQGSRGLTLIINITGLDSYAPEPLPGYAGRQISVNHYMLVPPAAYNERSWKWWLFEQILLVERHEAMEFMRIDGKPVYPPAHGPGNDPYLVLDYGTDIDRRTRFDGKVNPQ